MLIRYDGGDMMEQWKMTVLIGIGLIVLAIVFAILKKGVNIWTAVVIILGIVDIAIGFYRKKIVEEN